MRLIKGKQVMASSNKVVQKDNANDMDTEDDNADIESTGHLVPRVQILMMGTTIWGRVVMTQFNHLRSRFVHQGLRIAECEEQQRVSFDISYFSSY